MIRRPLTDHCFFRSSPSRKCLLFVKEQKQSCGQNIVAKLDGSNADAAEIKERVLETVNDEWAEEDDNDMVMMVMMVMMMMMMMVMMIREKV